MMISRSIIRGCATGCGLTRNGQEASREADR